MNQATKTQIENEAEEYAEKYGGYMTDYIAGATKYAELLEQEKATTEMLRKSLAHETTQRIFDNEKGEKLVAALEEKIKELQKIKDENNIPDGRFYSFELDIATQSGINHLTSVIEELKKH